MPLHTDVTVNGEVVGFDTECPALDSQDILKDWGQGVVLTLASRAAKIQACAAMKTIIKSGKAKEETNEQIQAALDATMKAWAPSIGRVSGPRKSPAEKAMDAFGKLSPEDQKAEIQKLMAFVKAQKQA